MAEIISFPGATIIEGNDEMRAKKCLQVIQSTLKMYRCMMVPQVIITGPQIESTIRVFPIPNEVKPEEAPPLGG